MPRTPDGPPPPPAVAKLRLRYAKRGRLRFTSHRDFARAFERALRRAGVPMAYSAGFTPHPKVSYSSAVPTGMASESEYVEISVVRLVDPEAVRAALDEVLPDGIDIVAAELAEGSLADVLEASAWHIELPGLAPGELAAALDVFLSKESVLVDKRTKSGRREVDVRGPVSTASASGVDGDAPCAILDLVVRHTTPAVRPDDILTGLRNVADLDPPVPPRATRVAQGALTTDGRVVDPFAADQPEVNGAPT